MNQTSDELWLAVETWAKTYPPDDVVRLTATLARGLIEERQRLQIPIPATIHQSINPSGSESDVAVAGFAAGRQSTMTSDHDSRTSRLSHAVTL